MEMALSPVTLAAVPKLSCVKYKETNIAAIGPSGAIATSGRNGVA